MNIYVYVQLIYFGGLVVGGENVHVPVRIFLKFIIIGISPLFNCDFYVSQQVKIAFIKPILW